MAPRTNLRAVQAEERQKLDSGSVQIDEARVRAERKRRELTETVRRFIRAETQREQRILIVEDNDQLARAYVTMLTALPKDCEIVIAQTSARAQSLLVDESFDLVILDLLLDRTMSGIDLAKFIREGTRRPLVPILMISGQTTELDIVAKLSGATAFLSKPVDVDRFVSVVAKLLHIVPDGTTPSRG